MKKNIRIISIMLVIVTVFSICVFAASSESKDIRSVSAPTMTVIGTTVKCSAVVSFAGQYIDATLELWQGSTLVTSWNKTGTSLVSFSETETIVHGLTYTLTISGTANGVAFPSRSITKTL